MSEGPQDVQSVQDELQVVVGKLEGIERSLIALRDTLPPPSPGEAAGEVDEQSDTALELRSVIDCVLTDSIRPAARDLRAASLYRGKREK
ncbi:MAG: hypothetical protein ACJ76Y_18900 [Thermoanaerobaculia bacterium]